MSWRKPDWHTGDGTFQMRHDSLGRFAVSVPHPLRPVPQFAQPDRRQTDENMQTIADCGLGIAECEIFTRIAAILVDDMKPTEGTRRAILSAS